MYYVHIQAWQGGQGPKLKYCPKNIEPDVIPGFESVVYVKSTFAPCNRELSPKNRIRRVSVGKGGCQWHACCRQKARINVLFLTCVSTFICVNVHCRSFPGFSLRSTCRLLYLLFKMLPEHQIFFKSSSKDLRAFTRFLWRAVYHAVPTGIRYHMPNVNPFCGLYVSSITSEHVLSPFILFFRSVRIKFSKRHVPLGSSPVKIGQPATSRTRVSSCKNDRNICV